MLTALHLNNFLKSETEDIATMAPLVTNVDLP